MKVKKTEKVNISSSKLRMKKKLHSPKGIKQKSNQGPKKGVNISSKRRQKILEDPEKINASDTEMKDEETVDKAHKEVSVAVKSKKEERNSKSIEKKNKNPYTVFVGNLPFTATPEEVKKHFEKAGNVKEVRLPQDKTTNRRRGFGYVQLKNRVSYEKALTLHHSHLLGRTINVEYTTQGKKGGPKEEKIKQKNLKLRALARKGILSSVRKKKPNESKSKTEGEPENQKVRKVKEKKKSESMNVDAHQNETEEQAVIKKVRYERMIDVKNEDDQKVLFDRYWKNKAAAKIGVRGSEEQFKAINI
ncbi:hypothetical protein J437_LFUL008331 [Ladona fulva]|uniref:RRM domain-containing protein n=1 Tax=Ladona fulva TaxID=123851 RepID=A0A8K0K5N5_LADFU|nr:hypothetical protein J437_LFUL008331 [Ladona fulva]